MAQDKSVNPVPCYVAESPIHGMGLFTSEPISEGEPIGFYEGEETLENGEHVLWVQQSDNEEGWIGYDGTNELRFLNHSDQANCEMDGQQLYAARDIEAHEELTINYGEWFQNPGSE